MPIYEFRCTACTHDFEELMFSRGATPRCPRCGCDEVVRRPSTFGTSGLSRNVGSGSSCSGCSRHSCAGCGSA